MITTIDIAVVICYVLLLVAVGVYSSKKVSGSEDYMLAGRSLGFLKTSATLLACTIGASATMGRAAKGYEIGVSIMWQAIAAAAGIIIFGYMSTKLRRADIWYMPDILEKRYGKNVRFFSAVILFFTVVAIYGAQIISLGIIFNLFGAHLGISLQTSIIIMGVVLVLYTFVGGLVAVTNTDIIQVSFILPLVAIILPGILFTKELPFSELVATLDPKMFSMGGVSIGYIVGIVLVFLPGMMIDPTIWQRAMAAKSDKVAKRSVILSGIVFLFYSLAVVFIGMGARVLLPNLMSQSGGADSLIPAMIMQVLPKGLVGVGLTAILAAAMSTGSGCLLVSSVSLNQDILPKIIKKQLTPEQELKMSKMSTLLIGALGIIFALKLKGIFGILMMGYGIFVAGLFVPIMLALYWEKATKKGATWSISISSILLITLYAMGKPFGIEPIIPSLLINLIVMVSVSLITYKPENATEPIISKNKIVA